ncbi:lactonase family protein [Streptomyces sp. KLOTTS4A1]|uniref:lactonase family protein n=1 Tax=Streptomyces sp. KLOTTS4A1 TaxID=3390996 RepID=UPI0039F51609
MAGTRAYIGSFTGAGGHGITTADLDPATGELTVAGATDALPDPSYLALADGLLYAVSETEHGALGAFDVSGDSPRLIGAPRPVHGSGPTHLTSADGHLLTANYGSGSVSVLPRAEGAAKVLPHQGSGPDKERQEGPHAHQVLTDPSGRWILSVDLGTDSVRVCSLDDGSLTVRREVPLRAGSGPRHMAFHPAGGSAYVLNELRPTLTVCTWEAGDGLLTPVREVPVLPGAPKGDAYPSALAVAPDGRFLWTATRGEDVISVFAPAAEGPALVGVADCGGHWPRDLAVHPSGRFLYAANERSGDVTWFRVDAQGIPRPEGKVAVPAASCVVFSR